MMKETKIIYFKTPADYRKWFEKNYTKATELWVGFYKKDSGKPSITWQESVDQALCFGWIDGIRKSIDEQSYKIRFTPRRPTSIWSEINIKKIEELKKLNLVTKEGWDIFINRRPEKSNRYSFEQRKNSELPDEFIKKIKANKKAWEYYSSQPSWYKHTSTFWIISAKQEGTKLRRLEQLIKDSAESRMIAPLNRKK